MDHNGVNDGDAIQQPDAGRQYAGITMTPELFEGMVAGFAKFTGDIHQARQLARETVLKPILQKAGVQDVTDIMANLERVFDSNTLEATIQALKQENQSLLDVKQTLQCKKQEMQTQVEVLKTEQLNLRDENERFQKQILELANKNEKLESDVQALQTDNEDLEKENYTLEGNKQDLQVEVDTLQFDYDSLEDDNKTLREDKENLMAKYQELHAQKADEQARHQVRIHNLNKACADHQETIKHLHGVNKILRSAPAPVYPTLFGNKAEGAGADSNSSSGTSDSRKRARAEDPR
ncbi:hypothetical protein PG988_000139 [Apiospora saccharicola]